LDNRPTTEQATTHDADQAPAEPEVKSGVTLPLTVSQLRWKLAHKAKQEPMLRHLQRRSQRPFRPPDGKSFLAHLQSLGLQLLEPTLGQRHTHPSSRS
jgi:hypothetical protein